MKSKFEKFGTSVKTFVVGTLVGSILYALSHLAFPWIGKFVGGLVLEKSPLIPKEPPMMALSIFLNNTYVVFVSAILPVGLALIDGKRRSGEGSLLPFNPRFIPKSVREGAAKLAPLVYYALPMVIMLENGAILSFFLSESAVKAGPYGVWTFVKLVAPHGLVEIPAIMGAGGLGLTLAAPPVKLLREGKPEEAAETSERRLKSRETGKALFLILALLAFGAVTEAFVTPALA